MAAIRRERCELTLRARGQWLRPSARPQAGSEPCPRLRPAWRRMPPSRHSRLFRAASRCSKRAIRASSRAERCTTRPESTMLSRVALGEGYECDAAVEQREFERQLTDDPGLLSRCGLRCMCSSTSEDESPPRRRQSVRRRHAYEETPALTRARLRCAIGQAEVVRIPPPSRESPVASAPTARRPPLGCSGSRPTR